MQVLKSEKIPMNKKPNHRITVCTLMLSFAASAAALFLSACSTPAQRQDARVDARVEQRVDRRYERRGWD